MIRYQLIGLIALVPVLNGCDGMGPGSRTDRAEARKFEAGYFSERANVAEQALLDRKGTYQQWQARGVPGYSYAHVYGIADSRLFMLYTFTGDTGKAERAYQSATNYLAQAALTSGRQPEFVSREDLRRIGMQAESGLPLRWKK
jgi:hypothetical protein